MSDMVMYMSVYDQDRIPLTEDVKQPLYNLTPTGKKGRIALFANISTNKRSPCSESPFENITEIFKNGLPSIKKEIFN